MTTKFNARYMNNAQSIIMNGTNMITKYTFDLQPVTMEKVGHGWSKNTCRHGYDDIINRIINSVPKHNLQLSLHGLNNMLSSDHHSTDH